MVAFRRHTLLPMGNCLYVAQVSTPHLTRSSLDRSLQWHDISRLPEVEGEKRAQRRFRNHPLGLGGLTIPPHKQLIRLSRIKYVVLIV